MAAGSQRVARWSQLTEIVHAYGLRAGAEVPIAGPFQQHAMYMVDASSKAESSPEGAKAGGRAGGREGGKRGEGREGWK